ncbi:hypothetical protein TKK_0003192 [Trichogramma kaykai]
MDHYQQTYSYCMYCLDMFPSGTLEHHLHSVCAGYRLAMKTNILPVWIPFQVNNIDNQTLHGVSLGTGSNFEEGQNENVSYIQNIIMNSHQTSSDDVSNTEPTSEEPQNENDTYPQENIMDGDQSSNDDVSSTEPNYEEPQNENDTYSQDNIMDCQQTSCSGDLSTELNCEGSQDENDDYNRTSCDGSLTELNCEEPKDEMDGNYVCNDCPTCSRYKRNHRYGSKGRLIWHIQTSHLSHYQRLYSCDEHQLLFINQKTLREHMKTDHRKRKNNMDKNPPAQTSNLAAHDETPHEGFQCNVCGKMFKNRGQLYAHHRSVHGPIKYIYGLCGHVLKKISTLNLHLKGIHSNEKNFTCPVENCSRSFTTKHVLSQHHKYVHQPKSHQCNECSKKFGSKSHLTHHKKNVHGPKTFPCDKCPKLFHTKSRLMEHQEIHGAKDHEVCGNLFTEIGSWRFHQLTHPRQ